MRQSLGLVEVRGLCAAVTVADAMAKSANVKLEEIENTRGSGYMTIKVTGDVGAVKAAVAAGKAEALASGKLVSVDVIARPIDSTGALFVEYTDKRTRPMCYKAPEAVTEVPPATPEPLVPAVPEPQEVPEPPVAQETPAVPESQEAPAPQAAPEPPKAPKVVPAADEGKAKPAARKTVRRRRKTPAKPKNTEQ